ncbi:hypothetical protein T310_4912 [Rasamsonia emersonii CBS 393.64]|uniref:Uncharacterized protein n=1 Tax=Rasamsonia emersonii (strain ATCC 16479 / CBS 393.64 / IMI 116815) TaxID=1408163 RepID=A0A0F4YTT8_RASE3|nr:hypothetical protein T310_4912 [Rasamsonia emersonii CBS 393.64]KKA21053.1 hypothetical protein T310_4912 [Rasamsonia emersonii CBS 393.64]
MSPPFLGFPYDPPNAASPVELPPNCSNTFTAANASGTYDIGNSFVNGPYGWDTVEDMSWTVTVAQTGGVVQSYSWLGLPPATLGIYSDRHRCQPAPSNLTAGSLPRVCRDILNAITAKNAVPDACAKFVGLERTWYDGVYSNISFTTTGMEDVNIYLGSAKLISDCTTGITGPNSTAAETCQFNTSTVAPSFAVPNSKLYLITQYESQQLPNTSILDTTYDEATTLVYPILTTLFPPANDSDRADSVDQAEAFFTCARPVNITAGSRVPPALPPPTPLPSIAKPLSTGAKAGIGVGLWPGLSFQDVRNGRQKLCKWRDRKKSRVNQANNAETKAPMLDGQTRSELSGSGRRPELDGTGYSELEASGISELEGSYPHNLR